MSREQDIGKAFHAEVAVRISTWWAHFHALMLAGWGAWVIGPTDFKQSVAYDLFAHLGSEAAIGVPVMLIGLMCFVLAKPERGRLVLVYGILGGAFAGICCAFMLGNWRSTGTWIYSMISLGHGITAVQLSALLEQGKVRYGE